MRHILTLTCALLTAVLVSNAAAEPVKFARYPHVSQGKLVFSYHGDIWIANENGIEPRAADRARRARYVPAALAGWQDGSRSPATGSATPTCSSCPAAGGEPKQLTFATAPDTVLNWTPDGKGDPHHDHAARSARGAVRCTSCRSTAACRTPLPMDGGVQGMIKQDGSTLAFNRMGGSYWRKGYRGNRSDDVWMQDLKTQKITRLTDTNLKDYSNFTQDVYPMWGSDGQIYFSSERSGHFNIWRIAADRRRAAAGHHAYATTACSFRR